MGVFPDPRLYSDWRQWAKAVAAVEQSSSRGIMPDGVAVDGRTGDLTVAYTDGTISAAGNVYRPYAAPVNRVAPTITSSAGFKVGATLTVDEGLWTGIPLSFTYGWFRNGDPIPGENARTYVPIDADVTATLTVGVQAINGYGSGIAVSVPTPVISATFTALRSFYFSAAGSDTGGDGSQGSPFRSVDKANTLSLLPGDAVLFRGTDTFAGSLVAQAGGSSTNRIEYSSYGGGRATISATAAHGFYAVDKPWLEVRDLNFVGSANDSSNVFDGILVESTNPSAITAGGPRIINNNISFFGRNGIAPVGQQSVGKGWDGTYVAWNFVHDCTAGGAPFKGNAAIQTYGLYPAKTLGYSHTNLTIERNTIKDCLGGSGGPFSSSPWSGTGIAIGHANGGLAQFNHVENCGGGSSGNVGVMFYESDSLVGQYNSVYKQQSPGGTDGDGLGFDIGCVNCVLQYNYAVDCDGPGIYAFAYEDPDLFAPTNNHVRFNIAENCSRVKISGQVWRGNLYFYNNATVAYGCHWYGNTSYVDFGAGVCFGINQPSGACKGYIANNLFAVGHASAKFIMLDGHEATPWYGAGNSYLFVNNCYSGESSLPVQYGTSSGVVDLHGWYTQTEHADQERLGGVIKALHVNARLMRTGNAGRVVGYAPDELSGYELSAGSPCADGGLDLPTALGINPGSKDFFGNSIPAGLYGIGAHDRAGSSTAAEVLIESTYTSSAYDTSYTGITGSGAGLRDSDDTSLSSTWVSSSGGPSHITADCITPKILTKLVVRPINNIGGWGPNALSGVKIETSLDGVTWTLAGYVGLTVAGADHTVPLGSVLGQYVRLLRANDDMGLATFAVYGI